MNFIRNLPFWVQFIPRKSISDKSLALFILSTEQVFIG